MAISKKLIKGQPGMNPKVDEFMEKTTKWKAEFEKMRSIALDCMLTEELKWGNPCYTFQDNNVVLFHGFKEYCAFLFFKGVLLQDPEKIMVQQTEQVQAGRHVRFTSLKEIEALEPTLKAYIFEAIEVEKAGLKVPMKKTSEYPIPEEFQARLNADSLLQKAFESLTPGRQRAYLLYFAAPKQSKTRDSRIDQNIQRILNGKGLND